MDHKYEYSKESHLKTTLLRTFQFPKERSRVSTTEAHIIAKNISKILGSSDPKDGKTNAIISTPTPLVVSVLDRGAALERY